MKSIPMPEFLQGRKDIDNGLWKVEELQSPTGAGAATNILARHMIVPTGQSPMARTVRAHEMMHARISPPEKDVIFRAAEKWGIDAKTVEVAEEYRVNVLVHATGFNVDALAQGSESNLGKVWASDENWNSIVLTGALFAGFKPTADLLRGVKQVNELYYKTMLAFIKELKKAINFRKIDQPHIRKDIASTVGVDYGYGRIPYGFGRYTQKIAKVINKYLEMEPKEDQPTESGEEVDNKPTQPKAPGLFANLIWDNSIPLKPHLKNNLMKRRTASDIGRSPRRINRALTDGKMFDRTVRRTGGMVVIDQSGSMHLTDDEIRQLVESAPGCTVVGYSHRAGSTAMPNAWILAKEGKIAERIRDGNSGNGVDGPILEWAAQHCRKGEPFIWVCDGLVTDGATDDCHAHLTKYCADLVIKHRIHMVNTAEEAVQAIRKAAKGTRLQMHATGEIESDIKHRR